MDRNSLILLLAFSCLLSLALSRPIPKSELLQISTRTRHHHSRVDQSNPQVRPNWPWPHWEYTRAPGEKGGPRWRFVYPPMPAVPGFTFPRSRPAWPHWEFVQPPIAAGSRWPPRDWPPRWRFVHPPIPSRGSTPAAATPAAA